MTRQTLWAAVCVVGVVCAAPLQHVEAQDGDAMVVVSVDGLIFEAPSDRSRVILRVQAGEQLKALGQDGDWVKVQLPRGTGWILARIVSSTSAAPPLAGIGEPGAERVAVVDEFADVKAGPGEAYLGIKRVFRGDNFVVAKRSEDGQWVQIRVDGDLGWVRADQLMAAEAVIDSPVNAGGAAGAPVDAGVDARADSGVDDIDDAIVAPLPSPGGGGEAMSLELRLGGGFSMASQTFSAATNDPRLQLYTIDAAMAGPEIYARAWLYKYLGVSLDYRLGIGTPIKTQLIAGQAPLELGNGAHRATLGVTGRYPLTEGPRPTWVGITAGYTLHYFDIQTVQPSPAEPPIFLTNTYTGVRLALEGSVALGPVDVWVNGGLLVLGNLGQGQFDSGQLNGTTFLGVEGGVTYMLGDFGVFVKGSFDSYESKFNGEATRGAGITRAVNTDEFLTLSTGLTWRPW